MITPIPSYYVTSIWPNAKHHIQAAIEYVDSGYTPDDILKKLIGSDMQLWIIGDYQAAAVTMLNIYPQHKSWLVVAVGGEGMDEWFDDLMETIEGWASKMGCKYVEEYGRKGWRKVGATRGYEETYVVMRKQVNE